MADATTRVAINEGLVLCMFAIFLVDLCGSLARGTTAPTIYVGQIQHVLLCHTGHDLVAGGHLLS